MTAVSRIIPRTESSILIDKGNSARRLAAAGQ